jgi:hypothetical protein
MQGLHEIYRNVTEGSESEISINPLKHISSYITSIHNVYSMFLPLRLAAQGYATVCPILKQMLIFQTCARHIVKWAKVYRLQIQHDTVIANW